MEEPTARPCPKCAAKRTHWRDPMPPSMPIVPGRLYRCGECGEVYWSSHKEEAEATGIQARLQNEHPIPGERLTLILKAQRCYDHDPLKFEVTLGGVGGDTSGLGVLWADLLRALKAWLDAPAKFQDAFRTGENE